MRSSRLIFYLNTEWAFRKNHRVLSRMRRIVQRLVLEDRRERVRELDEKIEQFKAEKLQRETTELIGIDVSGSETEWQVTEDYNG